MILTDEQVAEFQNIYRRKFGMEISREEAYEKGARLVRLMKIILKPMPEKECGQIPRKQELPRSDV